MISISSLTKATTEEQALESFLANLEALGLPARSWRTGGAHRLILRIVARCYSSASEVVAALALAGFRETSTGVWLTFFARSSFDAERRPAAFATGYVRFTNTGGGVFSYGPDEVRLLNQQTKKSYVNSAAFTLGAGEVKLVAIRATEVGSASSSAPGLIDTLETQMLGVVVTNLLGIAGTDEETDEELRLKCGNKLATLSGKGPRGAYEYAVQSALRLDGTPVNINRVAVVLNPATGNVSVYCASPTGTPTADDLLRVGENIEAVARPDSVTAAAYGVTTIALTNSIIVWARRTPGVDAAFLSAAVSAALLAAVKAYPISGIRKPPSTQGKIYGDFISGVAKSAHPSIFDVDGADADLNLAPGQVATLATTIDVRIVP